MDKVYSPEGLENDKKIPEAGFAVGRLNDGEEGFGQNDGFVDYTR